MIEGLEGGQVGLAHQGASRPGGRGLRCAAGGPSSVTSSRTRRPRRQRPSRRPREAEFPATWSSPSWGACRRPSAPLAARQPGPPSSRCGRRGGPVLGVPEGTARPALPRPPGCRGTGRLSTLRGFAFVSVPLDEVKAIRHRFDVTVNDVILAVCAGALRRWLLDHGRLPARPLIAAVPVSMRSRPETSNSATRSPRSSSRWRRISPIRWIDSARFPPAPAAAKEINARARPGQGQSAA